MGEIGTAELVERKGWKDGRDEESRKGGMGGMSTVGLVELDGSGE